MHHGEAMRPLVLILTLILGGCASSFHTPYEHVKQHCGWSADIMAERCRRLVAWGYSVPVPGGGEVLAYFGSYFSVPGEQRCQANRTNMLVTRRTSTANECHPITMIEGGPLWAISLLNSDDGFVFRSREACETGRRENDWSKAGYLPSACTPVSVTP